MLSRLKRTLRYHWLRLVRGRIPARSVALGLAVGVFVGFLPVIPFQTPLVLGLALALRCNKAAGLLGTWVANPLYLPAFYYLLYIVGSSVLPAHASFDPTHPEFREIVRGGWDLFLTMLAGGLILGLPSAACAYVLGLRGVKGYRRSRARRLGRRRALALHEITRR